MNVKILPLLLSILFEPTIKGADETGRMIQCSRNCEDEEHDQICNGNFVSDEELVQYGEPSKPPDFVNASVYITADAQLAISITWSDIGNCDTNTSYFYKQYLLEVNHSDGGIPQKVLFDVKQQCISKENLQVYINYKCYGLTEGTWITPASVYLLRLLALPIYHDMSNSLEAKMLPIPGCDDELVAMTANCKIKDTNTIFPPSPPYLTSSFASTVVTVTTSSSSDQVIVFMVVIFACGIIVLLSLVFVCFRKKFISTINGRKVLVVLSSSELRDDSWYSKAGDALACWLHSIGMHVTYTLWNDIAVNNSGPYAWMYTNVVNADHVIVISTPSCGRNLEIFHSEEHLLANAPLDPYSIAVGMIEGRCAVEVGSYAIVYFNESSENELSPIIPPSRVFQLPENICMFCQKVFGIANLNRNDISEFRRKLHVFVENIRSLEA